MKTVFFVENLLVAQSTLGKSFNRTLVAVTWLVGLLELSGQTECYQRGDETCYLNDHIHFSLRAVYFIVSYRIPTNRRRHFKADVNICLCLATCKYLLLRSCKTCTYV